MTHSMAVLLAVIVLQPLPKADRVVDRQTDRSVTLDGGRLGGSDLQVDLWAARDVQEALDLVHQSPSEPATLVRRIDAEVVDPPAVPVVPGHDGPDDRAIVNGNQEEVRTDAKFAVDIFARVVPRPGQSAPLPQGHDGVLVRRV